MSCLRITISTHLEIGRSIVPPTNVFQNLCSSEWRWSDYVFYPETMLMDTGGGLSSALATSFLTLGLGVCWGPCLHYIAVLLLPF